MKTILEDIKNNNYKKTYLLYGEEKYLIIQYKNKLKNALVQPDDTMNYSYFEGKDIDMSEIEDVIITMPFFADKRVVIIENSGLFKSQKSDDDEVKEDQSNAKKSKEIFLEKQAEDCVVVFVESEVDKRSKLYKYIAKNGYACEMKKQEESVLLKWILGLMKKEGKSITNDALKFFVESVGDDMERLYNELEKLLSYTLNKNEITKKDIEEVCVKNLDLVIFDITNAMMEKNTEKVLTLYHQLLAAKEAPMHILFLLVRQFNIIYQIVSLQKTNNSLSSMSKKMGMQEFIIRKSLPFAKNFSEKTLKSALDDLADCESKVKTGQVDDVLGLEMLLVKYTK